MIIPCNRFQVDFHVCFNHICGKGDLGEEHWNSVSQNIVLVWQPPPSPNWRGRAEGLLSALSSSASVYLIWDFHFYAYMHKLIHSHTSLSLCPSLLLSPRLFILDFFQGKTCSEMKIKVASHSKYLEWRAIYFPFIKCWLICSVGETNTVAFISPVSCAEPTLPQRWKRLQTRLVWIKRKPLFIVTLFLSSFLWACNHLDVNDKHVSSWQRKSWKRKNAASAAVAGLQTTF